MKASFPILILLVLVFAFSCKDDNPDTPSVLSTGFDIGSQHFTATKTTSYITSYGEMMKVVGADFELYIAISDTGSKLYTVTDTLKATDIGKARCIIKINNEFKFSTSGTINLESGHKSGDFSVNIEDLNLTNGKIKIDSTINEPIADFTQISGTDYNGWPMTTPDPNDWNMKENWSMEERFAFNLKPVNTQASPAVMAAYPNPCNQYLAFNMNNPESTTTDFVVVNANFEVERVFSGIKSNICMFDMNAISNPGDYYRMYYRVNSGSVNIYGSGDVKILK
ncbi:MAG: hypothetical protein ACOYN4_13750 [Bacteroidales bacterium]